MGGQVITLRVPPATRYKIEALGVEEDSQVVTLYGEWVVEPTPGSLTQLRRVRHLAGLSPLRQGRWQPGGRF